MSKKPAGQRMSSRAVAFENLTLEQAKELLSSLEKPDHGVFGTAGKIAFDNRVPHWSVNISMTESMSLADRVVDPAG